MVKFLSPIRKERMREPQKNLIYYDLMIAFRKKDCPVCFILAHKEAQYIRNLFYENVNDPLLRQKLRQAGGFCPEHTHTFLKIGDKLGEAIIAADLLSNWIEHIENTVEKSSCLLCVERKETELRIISDFVHFLKFEEFLQELEQSVGFCYSHFQKIMRKVENNRQAEFLLRFQSQKLKSHLSTIKQFIQKNDYRYRNNPIHPEEIEIIRLLWNFFIIPAEDPDKPDRSRR